MGQYNWTTCSKVIKAEVNTLQPERAFREALIKAMQAAPFARSLSRRANGAACWPCRLERFRSLYA